MAARCASCCYPLSVSDSVTCLECASHFHIDCAQLVGFPCYELSDDPARNTFQCTTCRLLPLPSTRYSGSSDSDSSDGGYGMPSRSDSATDHSYNMAGDMREVKGTIQDLSDLCKDMLREINELKSINLTLRCCVENFRHENEDRDSVIAGLRRRLDKLEGNNDVVDHDTDRPSAENDKSSFPENRSSDSESSTAQLESISLVEERTVKTVSKREALSEDGELSDENLLTTEVVNTHDSPKRVSFSENRGEEKEQNISNSHEDYAKEAKESRLDWTWKGSKAVEVEKEGMESDDEEENTEETEIGDDDNDCEAMPLDSEKETDDAKILDEVRALNLNRSEKDEIAVKEPVVNIKHHGNATKLTTLEEPVNKKKSSLQDREIIYEYCEKHAAEAAKSDHNKLPCKELLENENVKQTDFELSEDMNNELSKDNSNTEEERIVGNLEQNNSRSENECLNSDESLFENEQEAIEDQEEHSSEEENIDGDEEVNSLDNEHDSSVADESREDADSEKDEQEIRLHDVEEVEVGKIQEEDEHDLDSSSEAEVDDLLETAERTKTEEELEEEVFLRNEEELRLEEESYLDDEIFKAKPVYVGGEAEVQTETEEDHADAQELGEPAETLFDGETMVRDEEEEHRPGGQSPLEGEVQPAEPSEPPAPQHTEEDLWMYLRETVTNEHPSTVQEFLEKLKGTLQQVPKEYLEPVIEANIKRATSPCSTDGDLRSPDEDGGQHSLNMFQDREADASVDPDEDIVEPTRESPADCPEDTEGHSAVQGALAISLTAGFWIVWLVGGFLDT